MDLAGEAVAACAPRPLVARAVATLALPRRGRLMVLGAGKAAATMGAGVLDGLRQRSVGLQRLAGGLLVTRDEHRGESLTGLHIIYAGHPQPDARSAAAGRRLLSAAAELGPDDLALVLLSGGASALLASPLPGLRRADLLATNAALLASGAPITAVNCVRRHLSRVSGGRLAAACAARVVVLVVSDVLGNDLATIASGPCAADPSTFAEAVAIAVAAGVPARVQRFLRAGAAGELEETHKPGDPRLARVSHQLLLTPESLAEAALRAARRRGWRCCRLGAEAGEVGAAAERLISAVAAAEAEGEPPRGRPSSGLQSRWGTLLIGYGEPTVKLPARPGRGGRNQSLALALAAGLARQASPGWQVTALCLASDGSDGPTDAAGAVVDQGTMARAAALGLDGARALAKAAAYPFLDRLGALIRTGPTGTNVLDLHLVAVEVTPPPSARRRRPPMLP